MSRSDESTDQGERLMSTEPSDSRRTVAVGIRRVGDHAIAVNWQDGSESVIALRDIRIACGCAVCCNELTGEQVLDPKSVPDDIQATRIAPVGNYALTFEWSDGHATGIHPWEHLRELADRCQIQ